VEEFVVEVGVSVNIARTQLKSALAKTGTRRQGELIALILRSARNLGCACPSVGTASQGAAKLYARDRSSDAPSSEIRRRALPHTQVG
jgi:hypothetical protein